MHQVSNNDMWQLWIAAAGLGLTFITTIVLATIRITRFVSKENIALQQLVYRKFTEANTNLNTESDKLKVEFSGTYDKLRSEFGETLKALRTHVEKYEEKLYQVEIYIRDNYIEVPTFKDVIDDLKEDIKRLSEKLDDVFKRKTHT